MVGHEGGCCPTAEKSHPIHMAHDACGCEGMDVSISCASCSFSTSEDTKAYLSKSHGELIREEDAELLQNKSPKVDAATMQPISWPKDPSQEWCALCASGQPCQSLQPAAGNAIMVLHDERGHRQ